MAPRRMPTNIYNILPLIALLARELGGHPNSTRHLLDALVRRGFAARAPLETHAAGRKPYGYSLTPEGRSAAREPLSGFGEVLQAVAAYASSRSEAAERGRDLGALWGRSRAQRLEPGDVTDPWHALADDMGDLGFSPSVIDEDSLVLRRCPLIDLTEEHADFVCPLHRGMAEGLLSELGAPASIQLLPFGRTDGCVLRRVA